MIDGGKGQVGVAAEVLAEQGLHQLPLIGIAKGPERKPGEEDIVFPNRADVLILPSDHPGLHLLQQIRDEAHRFAIQGHRARRGKARNDVVAAGHRRHRRQAPQGAARAFRRPAGRAVGERRRSRARAGRSRALAERIYAQLH